MSRYVHDIITYALSRTVWWILEMVMRGGDGGIDEGDDEKWMMDGGCWHLAGWPCCPLPP